MRSIIYLFVALSVIGMFFLPDNVRSAEEQAMIIEVEGDPHEKQVYLKRYMPGIRVIKTYDTLFDGLAIKATPQNFKKMAALSFVKTMHPVRAYETQANTTLEQLQEQHAVFPEALNQTSYTGRGVKVGVIDTGIDYDHPDLQANYKGGYDLVDLDDDPMETQADQGVPTSHGTHVSGIIAANGTFKGVAPEADLYAYRALGPGGVGSSVHVIAALEQAVKDEMDVINLSLGNAVNGPDYPTSIAVNRAADLGVAVVIANGNDGPDLWSIGAPATADKALSVGATTSERTVPRLNIGVDQADILLTEMHGSIPWQLKKDYQVACLDTQADLQGKIAIAERGETSFFEKAEQAQKAGAVALIVYNNEKGLFEGSVADEQGSIAIPVVAISQADGLRIIEKLPEETVYAQSTYEQVDKHIAEFSSRGPVAVNWHIKPDLLAPGTDIVSTVPGGYQAQQGTSMAAPHVAGAMALLKEAQPQWTNEQIIGALKTTADPIATLDGKQADPMSQGMGEINVDKAIHTNTIIVNPLLAFGKTDTYRRSETIQVPIENTTNKTQQYHFSIPKKQPGLTWELPQTFTLKAKERKDIPVTLHMTPQQLEEDIHQGRLVLNQGSEHYHLPYLFINKTADYPRAMGLEFTMDMFDHDTYTYKLYVTDDAEEITVQLYEPDTLKYDRQLLHITAPTIGMNEGELKAKEVGAPGYYLALVNVSLEDGTYETYQTELYIPQR